MARKVGLLALFLTLAGGLGMAYSTSAGNTHNVLSYGADCTGVSDSTAAFNAAIQAARTGLIGHTVYIPSGVYRITGTLLIKDVRPFRMVGDGPGSTVLVWDGAAGGDMLRVQSAQHVELSGFELRGTSDPAKKPRTLLDFFFETPCTYVNHGFECENLWIGGVGASSGVPNMADFGVRIWATTDSNNSEHSFRDCHLSDCNVGVSIEQTQAKAERFYNCNISSCNNCIKTTSGSFQIYGGNFNAVPLTGIVFNMGSPCDTTTIIGLMSETSGRLIVTGNGVPGGSPFPIQFIGGRFSCDAVHADRRFAIYSFRGVLSFDGVIFDSGDSADPPKIYVSASTNYGAVVVENCSISWGDSFKHGLLENWTIGCKDTRNVYMDNAVGGVARREAGEFVMTTADGSSKAFVFEVPFPQQARPYVKVIPCITSRSGASVMGCIKSCSQDLNAEGDYSGFTVELSEPLTGDETLTISWILQQA